MSLRLVDRFYPRLRREQQIEIDAGRLHMLEETELLDQEHLRPLALFSLWLLVIGSVFFIALTVLAYVWHMRTLSVNLTAWRVAFWIVVNIISYIIVLPLHEAIHATAFAFWGGKPYFGAKLPLALYCGAKEQLFRRNQYLVVGLAPVVVITGAGIILTLIAPVAASYTLLATAGNISGAAGDIWVAQRLLRLPADILVEDTETGYRVWEIQ